VTGRRDGARDPAPERLLALRCAARDVSSVGCGPRGLAAFRDAPALAEAPLPPQIPARDRLEDLAAADEIADGLVNLLDRHADGARDLALAAQEVARHGVLEVRQDARTQVRLPHGRGL